MLDVVLQRTERRKEIVVFQRKLWQDILSPHLWLVQVGERTQVGQRPSKGASPGTKKSAAQPRINILVWMVDAGRDKRKQILVTKRP